MSSNLEELAVPESIDAPVNVRRFSDEARKALIEEGYSVYELTGRSIAVLRWSGELFWSTWHENFPNLEAIKSMTSDVAIKLDQPFIPESNRKTLTQQEEMIASFSSKIGETIPEVTAIMGSVPDYAELVLATDYNLFGEAHGFYYARTKTIIADIVDKGVGTVVGCSRPFYGISVGPWYYDIGYPNIFAAPLVVPINKVNAN